MITDPSYLQQHPLISSYFEVVKEKYRLTKRENEVLQILVLRGASNKELGEFFSISEKTLKNHVASIQRKLVAKSCREVQSIVYRDTLLPIFLNVFHPKLHSSK